MYGVTCRGHRYYCDSHGASMQRSVHVALKAAARKSKKEWTFVCDGTVLGRADPRYVSRRRGAIASHDPLQDEDGY